MHTGTAGQSQGVSAPHAFTTHGQAAGTSILHPTQPQAKEQPLAWAGADKEGPVQGDWLGGDELIALPVRAVTGGEDGTAAWCC